MATLVLTDTQKADLSISPVDSKGNPAKLDGVPTWASSDATIVTVSGISADGLSATVYATGPAGTATVAVSGDADLGAGVTTITGTLDVSVTGGAATAIAITAGTPTEQ